MNYTAIVIVCILALVLVVFTIIRNQKDKKDLEKTLNNDYQESNDQKGDFDEEDDL
ncbi:FeoB-associated Cys-rich membrane protein [Flavobacterium sp.]|uniref:FeoB-associated Cys-rich membrane protein n=1 Tax=Flavobacterium sp. TaxID=239 RepID=UPI00286E76FD|nr:FeoB-associated Cys-rich membrane protein [Flavobacterium sp.]